MRYFVCNFFLFLFIGLATAGSVEAQVDEQCPHIKQMSQRGSLMDDSPAVREQLIKLCIRQIKKEFDELVERTEEISRLADELKESYDRNDSLSKDDQEKLEKIEDLVKKVRKDLKASDDDEDEDDPASVADALNMLQGQATGLLVEIRKSTRHSISLATIKTSNALLRLAKFLQLRK